MVQVRFKSRNCLLGHELMEHDGVIHSVAVSGACEINRIWEKENVSSTLTGSTCQVFLREYCGDWTKPEKSCKCTHMCASLVECVSYCDFLVGHILKVWHLFLTLADSPTLKKTQTLHRTMSSKQTHYPSLSLQHTVSHTHTQHSVSLGV